MKLSDYAAALKMRDIFKEIVHKTIDDERPRHEYGSVTEIDRVNRRAMVLFPEDEVPVEVKMGSIQPASIGQTVRVGGVRGDRFIDDVMGIAYVAGITRPGDLKASMQAADHDGWLVADGRVNVPTESNPELFALIGYGYGGSGALFGLPDWRGRTIVGAGTGTSLTNRVLGSTFGTETHTLVTAEMPSHTHIQDAHSHPNPAADDGWYGIRSNASTIRITSTSGGTGITFTANTNTRTATNQNTGGGGAHNNMQPSRAANIFIKGG